jgi:hypothetical protein
VFYDLGIVNDFFKGAPGSWALSDAVANDTDAIADLGHRGPGRQRHRSVHGGPVGPAHHGRRERGRFKNTTRDFWPTWGGARKRPGAPTKAKTFILQQVENMRDSVSGVSTEEELANLIKFQRAFEMAARSVRAADEMFQTLINMIQR